MAADVRRARADVARARAVVDGEALRLVARIKQRVAEVRYHERALDALLKSEAVAVQFVTLASERLTSGAGSLFDVTKARTELAQLNYDRIRFEELLRLSRARLNSSLNRSPRAPLQPMPELALATAPAEVETLYTRALAKAPGMRERDAVIGNQEALVDRARGRLFPDVMVGAQLMINGPATVGTPPDSGEDAVGVSVGISLPIWVWADRASIRSAEAGMAAAIHAKRAYVLDLLSEIEDVWLRHRAAVRLVDLYDSTLLPQAQTALADAEAWRRTGSTTFAEFLDARATLYRFELARERAWADAVSAEASLEGLVGGPL
ncbi:MAG: cobalt-zinc-cadmium efflux system outer membrane protein [Myxococcota bacterium]|jgi:cobalt-zinc-cadmium efflux system outer membrane protein